MHRFSAMRKVQLFEVALIPKASAQRAKLSAWGPCKYRFMAASKRGKGILSTGRALKATASYQRRHPTQCRYTGPAHLFVDIWQRRPQFLQRRLNFRHRIGVLLELLLSIFSFCLFLCFACWRVSRNFFSWKPHFLVFAGIVSHEHVSTSLAVLSAHSVSLERFFKAVHWAIVGRWVWEENIFARGSFQQFLWTAIMTLTLEKPKKSPDMHVWEPAATPAKSRRSPPYPNSTLEEEHCGVSPANREWS